MILYSKEPLSIKMKNIMMLDDIKTGGVVYVSKQTYDQALLLFSRFDNNKDRLLNAVASNVNSDFYKNENLVKYMNDFFENAPKPINALAVFLINAAKHTNIEWNLDNVEIGYGILHMMSRMVDFNAMTLVSRDVRASLDAPAIVLMSYKESWENLLSTLEDYIVSVQPTVITKTVEKSSKKETEEQVVEVSEPEEEEEEEEEEDNFLERMWANIKKINDAPDSDFVKKDEEKESEPAPAPVQTQTVSAETNTAATTETPAMKVLNSWDI